MGYYDEHVQSREEKAVKKRGVGGYFLASFVGIILGALLVIVAVPALLDYNVLPPDSAQNESEAEQNVTGNAENVSLDVTTTVTDAVEKAGDTVVGISNIQSSSFWTAEAMEAGTGSGVIYKIENGTAFVVTNYHVVQGADELEVTLADGTKKPAEILGGDVWTDLAVISIDSEGIEDVAEFGDSSALKQGEPVIAIGNPLGLQFSGSVTQGIVSGIERTIPVDIDSDGMADWNADVLQTDAAINPGNSGGALVNISGQLIGINSMKIAQSEVEGIGLAIPINSAIPIIDDLETHGEVKRPTMGVNLLNVSEVSSYHQQETLKLPEEVKTGVVINEVVPNSPAAIGGLEELDVIVEMDGEKIDDIIQLRQFLYTKKTVGDGLELTIYRNGQQEKVTITLTDEGML
ncbi:serine protease [Bacillus coahuilensis m2-6]|uniref:Serine protease n=1 Tax=Bacillus coahuilensis p1.1.43 TaxID=1150625 RepID=A0A147KCM0_9BACI|nr:trypsin-like peptidase domain-containing protein [Bacillus coahuilensis]KUP09399.1 serine protease [Bacillus coahuilensis p1.1.43]KUP10001.1 serine protease [Bacillus coahuilensis m2-6]